MPNETDQPLTEAELAHMFAEEGRAQASEPPAEKTLDEVLDPEPEEEIVVEEPAIEIPPEKERPDDPDPSAEPAIVEIPDPDLQPESFEQPEHLAWAERRNLTNFEDAAKLAFEQERFLGRRASEIQELREQLEQQPQAVPGEPPLRSEEWIASVLSSPDPGRYAWELARGGEWTSYASLMEAWETIVGPTVTMNVHQQIVGTLDQEPEPEPEPQSNPERIREAFALVGIFDLDNHPLRGTIIQVADEMGANHPLVQGAAVGDPMAVSAIVEIARSRTLTTRTLRMDGSEVDQSRKAAAAVTDGGDSPSRTPSAPDPFEKLDVEWRRMGVLRDE